MVREADGLDEGKVVAKREGDSQSLRRLRRRTGGEGGWWRRARLQTLEECDALRLSGGMCEARG